MKLREKLFTGLKDINKCIFPLIIPIFIDLLSILTHKLIFGLDYDVPEKFFIFKLGTISAPPSIEYLLENYPSLLIKYTSNNGFSSIIKSMDLFNILLFSSCVLVLSFLKSGYMGCLEKCGKQGVTFFDFCSLGNKNWFKFFVLELICVLPSIVVLMYNTLFYVLLIMFVVAIIIYYVKYSIVVDNVSLRGNFLNGIRILERNMWVTFAAVFYYGAFLSLLSFLILPLCKLHFWGIVLSILIIDYLGMGVNKAMLELYRELREKELITAKYDSIEA